MLYTLCQPRKLSLIALFAMLHLAVAAQLHQLGHLQDVSAHSAYSFQGAELLEDNRCEQPLLHLALAPANQSGFSSLQSQYPPHRDSALHLYELGSRSSIWARAPPALSSLHTA